MRVEIWIRNDYARTLDDSPVKHSLVFAFEDSSGLAGEALAERTWNLLAGLAPHKLSDEDLQIRDRFDAACGGRILSAGDVVVAGSTRYVCRPGGWDIV